MLVCGGGIGCVLYLVVLIFNISWIFEIVIYDLRFVGWVEEFIVDGVIVIYVSMLLNN